MRSKEFLLWLEEKNLMGAAQANSVHFRKVLKECLAARDEELLIIGDTGFRDRPVAPIIAGSYYLAAKDLGLEVSVVVQGPKFKGEEADTEVIDALSSAGEGKILALALSNRLGSIKDVGKSFRNYINKNRHRFASSTSLGMLGMGTLPRLISAVNTDYAWMREKGMEIKRMLDKGNEVHITTKAGTDLFFGIKGKESVLNAGDYTKEGTGGNVPAGEVYTAPKRKNVEGKVVIDGSSSYKEGTQIIKDPITMEIEKDEVVDIRGGKEAETLSKTIEWACERAKYPWGIRRIGELGIGINPDAGIVGATIIDEKTLGTAHIAIGSNYWFGGTIYAIIHLDQIFRDPVIEIDGETLNVDVHK